MKEKILVIDSCLDCKYFTGFTWKCSKLDRIMEDNIEAPIPEDCPLEDKKD